MMGHFVNYQVMKDNMVQRITTEMRERIRSRLRQDLRTRIIRLTRRKAFRDRRSSLRNPLSGRLPPPSNGAEEPEVIVI